MLPNSLSLKILVLVLVVQIVERLFVLTELVVVIVKIVELGLNSTVVDSTWASMMMLVPPVDFVLTIPSVLL